MNFKYENIKFVPAAEISFPIKCDVSSPRYATAHNLTESAEMLTYCINPFTENSKNFFKTLYQKRALGKEETIQLANKIMPTADFSENEYNFLYYNNLWQQNNHWRLHDYIQIKNRVLRSGEINYEF